MDHNKLTTATFVTRIVFAAMLALGSVGVATACDRTDSEATEDSDQQAEGALAAEETGAAAKAAGDEATGETPSPSHQKNSAEPAASSRGIKVQRMMNGARSSRVPRNVQTECRGFGTILPSTLAKLNDEVVLVEKLSGKGKRLVLNISYLRAKGGGAFSGSKKMEVTGKLLQGSGKVLGSFTAYRGSYKGKACKSLYRVEQELARDIAHWLQEPGMHDKLGAAR